MSVSLVRNAIRGVVAPAEGQRNWAELFDADHLHRVQVNDRSDVFDGAARTHCRWGLERTKQSGRASRIPFSSTFP